MKKIFLPFLIFAACSKKEITSPEAALQDFIETRMGTVSTKEEMLSRVTGKLQQSLENVSPEDFQKYSDLRNLQKSSFKVLSKSCQAKKCFITYSLAYQTKRDEKAVFSSEVKKIAELQELDGRWLIADVSNIKTYLEALEPINALEDKAQ